MPSGQFTFLQVSDVHLDSSLSSGRIALSPAKRRQRTQEILAAFLRAMEVAKQRKVDAVLIPGDLWDSESVTTASINAVIEKLIEMPEIPVFIAPGNHDYCSADSMYSQDALALRGMRRWPDNVHIFRSPQFEIVQHPRRPEVSITGRAFTGNVSITERLLCGHVEKDASAAVNILMFHGALDGYDGKDGVLPGKRTAPFSVSELVMLGFDYAAVGHYHRFTELRTADGALVGCYTGCLSGRGVDETGPKYAVIGKIDLNTGMKTLERIELDERRIVEVTCDVSDLTRSQAIETATDMIEEAGAREAHDIVVLRLEGTYPVGAEPDYFSEYFGERYFHFCLVNNARADYLTDGFDEKTTEGKFVQAMLELKERAEAAGGVLSGTEYGDELPVKVIEDALYYGMDALRQKKVMIRNVD
jgi:DNA repair exonuclease SbcCD nuclease subunit